ncbi:Protocadherin Fat 4 isoform X1 [Oopsacas minuta]|uniref:Protocadherin Fat 4 isoform X1 n=1 Tax=Oopsacas minuta TaxID=111878 RepID=A0AAV7JCV3_9METZ|nr:Protocadherin Fat 4 isoform X1 [Oopsacas minuta]
MLSLHIIKCIVLLLLSLIQGSIQSNIANFTRTLYQTSFLENQPVGTSSLRLELQTVIPTSLITISLQGHLNTHFFVSSDDIIHNAVILDRENTSQYDLIAIALYNNSIVSSADVSIKIKDVNDNSPYCDNRFYSVEVNETYIVDSILGLQCWDLDEGYNSSLIYYTQNNYSTFTISSNGSIGLYQSLDYEQYIDGILLEVTISDQGDNPLTTEVFVFVTILPVNEFAPQFVDLMPTSISENTKPGSRITQISALDLDSGKDGDVFYYLTSPEEEDLFHLDVYSGSLYLLRSLDHERSTSYSLHITASNSATRSVDSLNTSTVLLLTILDIPDDLHFSTEAEFSTVSEDIEIGVEITLLKCETSSIMNLDISYSITSPSSHPFCIHTSTGAIYTRSFLDYETQPNYHLTVSCSCCSSPSLQSHASLFISLSDVNDFPPMFSPSEYVLYLSEQTEPGADILHLNTTDMDTGIYGQVQYQLLNHQNMFYLHSNTGILYLRGILDYTQSPYNVTILAANSYTPLPSDPLSNRATVQILITEYFRDMPPNCPQDTEILILEETTALGQSIATISCNNNDTLNLDFFILSPNITDLPFYVSLEGNLFLQDYLDYDMSERFYLIEIQAIQTYSPFYASSVFLHVIVTPVNEHKPVFNQTQYSLSLSEFTAVSSNIFSVLASDEDSAPDGGVIYTFLTNFDTFSIDPVSGLVYLISALDYNIMPEYNLSIIATDYSNNPFSSTAILNIHVINENNGPPICNPTHIQLSIFENITSETVVAMYLCTDPDNILLPTEFVLSLSSPINQILSANHNSIVLTSQLDYELITAYTGVLVVSEPNSTFSSHITIFLLVEQSNDFSPFFTNLPYQLIIDSSTVDPLYPVYSVIADDLDAGIDGDITFSIQDHTDLFLIDKFTGEIWLIYPVKQITNNNIELTILATDKALSDPLTNSSILSISIIYQQVYSCESYFYSLSVSEDIHVNSTLLDVNCQSPAQYILDDVIFSQIFRVESNGSLILTIPLDAERYASYFSTISVIFAHNTSLTVAIVISVQDVNEFPPSFISPTSYLEFVSNIQLGTLLITYLAIDRDISYNKVEYSLVDAIPGLYISPSTGELYLSSRDIFSLSSPINVSIMARDNAPNTQNSTTELLLNIIIYSIDMLQPSPSYPIFIFSVREDQPLGYVVGMIECINSVNISYVLQSDNTFYVQRETGKLILDKSLNYAQQQSYTLDTSCYSNNLSSQFFTIVTVVDINEYPPVLFPDINTVYLYENTTVGELIHTVSCYDPDNSSTHLYYEITHVEPNQSIFTISHATGEIYLLNTLDYEIHTSYTLYITVYDGISSHANTQRLEVILTIHVLDINDNSPVCPHILTLHITHEDNNTRELVNVLNCSDTDSTAITNLKYFEINTLYGNYFELEMQGNPPAWYLYFLLVEARESHNGSLFNAYFHNIKCCDGSTPELCTVMLVLVTTVVKPILTEGLNATQLGLAIRSEGLENVITLFFNISESNWIAVVDHFKLVTANILTAYCIRNPFKCSILEDCSSQR